MKITQIQTNISKISLFLSLNFLILFCFSGITYAKEVDPQNVFVLINSSRTQENLNPLHLNPTLSKVAQSKAADMAKKQYFAHTSPEGVTPWHWFEVNNYTYKYAGENLAINYDDAREEHEAWMDSPTHKKNILSSNFSEIGIATATGIIDGKKSKITVTVFGTPQKNIFAANAPALANRNSYILGAQTSKSNAKPIVTAPSYSIGSLNTKLFDFAKQQSNNIIWTIALIAMLIVSRDIVLKTIQTKSFHHKHSMVNLILFIMIYTILF